jgi:2,3-diketo-5-methylthio-1-phosphopentane phosphatase
MDWRVLCDFDGTIAVEDVTDSILERFALDGWQTIEERWKSGEIGSRECMARQIELIRASRLELDEHLDEVVIDPGFPAFATFCRRNGVPLSVVSDGMDYAIERILARHDLTGLPVIANHLESAGPRHYRLTFPFTNPTCSKASGTCKCHVAETETAGRAASLLIGDGASDMCAAGSVDLVFAKDKLLAHCRENGLPFVAFRDFSHAKELLATLLDEPVRLGIASAFG